jgi:predicted RNA polymerase sigma factor
MLEISRALLIAERDGRVAALAELDAIAARNSQRGFVLACAEQVTRTIADVVPAR